MATEIDKKIKVNEQTYQKLKNFSRQNGLKLKHVLATLSDIVYEDNELGKRVVELSLQQDSAQN